MRKLYLSHSQHSLVDALAKEIFSDQGSPLQPQKIFVPDPSFKAHLLLELTKRSENQGIGLVEVHSVFEGMYPLSGSLEKRISPTLLFFLLYQTLGSLDEPAIQRYLEKKPEKTALLAEKLAYLWFQYGKEEELSKLQEGWQQRLLRDFFIEGKYRLPIQLAKESCRVQEKVFLFGFDFLPEAFWAFFSKVKELHVFLFSPCKHYWGDLLTEKKVHRLLKGTQDFLRAQILLEQGPLLLRNLGELGRRTLSSLDALEWEIEECYPKVRAHTGLKALQKSLLEFEEDFQGKEDATIQVFQAGTSPLKELEFLKQSLLHWMKEKGCNYSDIAVLTPKMGVYAPLIETIFQQIPYRLFGISLGAKSTLLQGFQSFFSLVKEGLYKDIGMKLFENPAFLKRQGWERNLVRQFAKWLKPVRYLDEDLTYLLDSMLYLFPEEKQRIEMGSSEALELLLEKCMQLQKDVEAAHEKKTLVEWAYFLEELRKAYFWVDTKEEAEGSFQRFFEGLMKDLRQTFREGMQEAVSIDPIVKLFDRPMAAQLHSSYLHGIVFAPYQEAHLVEKKLILLLGMDAESFPPKNSDTSLDLRKTSLKGQQARYLFLKTLFFAKEALWISYPHLSKEDGSEMKPALVVQELMRKVPCRLSPVLEVTSSVEAPKKPLVWPEKPQLGEAAREILIADLSLLTRHPWKFYLKKERSIAFRDFQEDSFLVLKAQLSRQGLKKPIETILLEEKQRFPLGLLGQALKREVQEKVKERQELLDLWDLKEEGLFSILLRKSCRKRRKIREDLWENPALSLTLSNGEIVHLVGEVKLSSEKGFVHTGEDQFTSLLKVWAECLISSLLFESKQVFFLKAEKTRTLKDPLEALKRLVEYALIAQRTPSPLHPDWADAFLRKKEGDLERFLQKRSFFTDPLLPWLFSRIDAPSPLWLKSWTHPLEHTFEELISLYPTRRKKDAPL